MILSAHTSFVFSKLSTVKLFSKSVSNKFSCSSALPIFLFSLFFLISTAFSCQKKFHAQLNNMASCNEGILFPVALDSIEFLGWHDFNAYSDDGSAFSDDDSVIFCIRFEKIFLLNRSRIQFVFSAE